MPDDLNPVHLGQATDRFQRAHFQALLQDWLANLRGANPDLLPYEEVRNILEAREGVGRASAQNVPLEKIVGSVGRYRDFNRTFLPRNEALLERWRRVDAAMHSLTGVPPIDLYQIGDLYFVRDGNHRVSVARTRGDKTIEAYVTQVDAPFPVEADSAEALSEWLTEAGHRLFLERTQLQSHFPDADIRLMRRIRRDLEQRGRSFASVRDQYYATVRPMHLEFVEPSKRWARWRPRPTVG